MASFVAIIDSTLDLVAVNNILSQASVGLFMNLCSVSVSAIIKT